MSIGMQKLSRNYKTQVNEIYTHFGCDNDTKVGEFGTKSIIIEYNDGKMKRTDTMFLTKMVN